MCKTFQVELFTALLECRPGKSVELTQEVWWCLFVTHLVARRLIFYRFYIVCRMWVPKHECG